MSVGQKLTMLKIRSTSVAFLSLRNLEAAPEEALQLKRLIKSSNESLGTYLFGKIKFWNFYKKIIVKNFFRPKNERFFHENRQKHVFLTNIGIFCFKYVISML